MLYYFPILISTSELLDYIQALSFNTLDRNALDEDFLESNVLFAQEAGY